jgi:hypothetical protein
MDTITLGRHAHVRNTARNLCQRGLSLKAIGLLLLLLELQQQDPDVPLSVNAICSLTKHGRDGIQAGLAELECHGLLIRSQSRTGNGRLGANHWILDPQNQLTTTGGLA